MPGPAPPATLTCCWRRRRARVLGTVPLIGASPATATLTVSGLTPGEHTLTATYLGDATCATSASPPVLLATPPSGSDGKGAGQQFRHRPYDA